MSIKAYAKKGFFFSLENDLEQTVMYFTPSFKGELHAMRLKALKKDYSGSGSVKALVYSGSTLIAESSVIPYASIADEAFYYTLLRFDFADIPITTREYTLKMLQTGADAMTDSSFLFWQLEHNFRINTQSPLTTPFEKAILAAEIYIKRDYYEFD
jgi:hypothetical protein